jgi:hypothetical protein
MTVDSGIPAIFSFINGALIDCGLFVFFPFFEAQLMCACKMRNSKVAMNRDAWFNT